MKEEHTYNLFGVSKYYRRKEANPHDESLSVQRLRKGNVKQLRLSSDTYAHTEPFKQETYKGLHEYIRTAYGSRKVPTYIFDNHNHALFGWYEALQEKHITRGATLIHIDEHDDAENAIHREFNPNDLSSVAQYAKSLQIYNFIAPAVRDGLISNFLWVQPTVGEGISLPGNEFEGYIPFNIIGMDDEILDRVILEEFQPEQIIVDLDIDYFRAAIETPQALLDQRGYEGSDTLLRHDMNRVQALLAVSGVNTIATSPGYIDQTSAISLIKQVL